MRQIWLDWSTPWSRTTGDSPSFLEDSVTNCLYMGWSRDGFSIREPAIREPAISLDGCVVPPTVY